MGKAFELVGYFLIGISITGLFSYSSRAFANLQPYGFWLSVAASLLLIVAGVADDFFCSVLGLSYQNYIGALISVIAVLIVGGVIQWID
ncbi:hypothetical protein Cri9333_4746 (plasmid) [Crinalium epipsammum PCC 9333]|uniref:Uncharacterized protein n=1 Tax=Crinalium epipsammum PCC 9333 TaxID=1173022 RepID=K9W6Z2_9CYAN|nr:hypothetical protein [Crinalium epipsammum]AFZ15522.1 hypothetical protein Cri9333_4746 [Crinalium epipsammum PCC 9333]